MADRTETERRPGTGANGAFESGDGAPSGPPPLPKAKMAGYFEGETLTRRALFSGGAMAAGGIAGAAIILPAVGFALGPVFDQVEEVWQDAGPIADFSPDDYTPKVLTLDSTVGEAGKTTVYIRKGNTALDENESEVIAISTRCAHLGCPVRWVSPAQRFVCPCHGGVYNAKGEVEGGPPVRPLDRFETRVQNGTVQIGPRYSVNSELEKFSARDPGEPLDGLWQYLYPKRFSVPSA
jgi:Rieske Fe-S protein